MRPKDISDLSNICSVKVKREKKRKKFMQRTQSFPPACKSLLGNAHYPLAIQSFQVFFLPVWRFAFPNAWMNSTTSNEVKNTVYNPKLKGNPRSCISLDKGQ